MNALISLPRTVSLLLAPLLLAGFPATAQEALDCRPVVEQLRKNIESAPKHVLTLLEDAVIANGGNCIGEFVQTAIEASHADADMVKKIVFIAITNASRQAPQIAEAAVAAAPKHADSVRAAFAEAFDEKNPRLKPADPIAAPPSNPKPAATIASPGSDRVPIRNLTPRPAQVSSAPSSPKSHDIPVVVASGPGDNPYTNIDNPSANGGWKVIHDGIVEQAKPSPEETAAAGQNGAPQVVPPPPLGEDPVLDRKKFFGLQLPSLPSLPALPPVDQPIDLYFHSPFGGIPTPDQGSR